MVHANDKVHCCWPGQAWSSVRQVCVGYPTCPRGFRVEGEACVSPDTERAAADAEQRRLQADRAAAEAAADAEQRRLQAERAGAKAAADAEQQRVEAEREAKERSDKEAAAREAKRRAHAEAEKHAEEEAARERRLDGLELGFRTGYALPFGQIIGGGTGGSDDLNKVFNGVVPLWFDLGYRVGPTVSFGAFFQYGFGVLNTSSNGSDAGCKTSGVSCSASDLTFGADFAVHLSPDGSLDPWLSAGIGYEVTNISVASTSKSTYKGSYSGIQLINLQAGVDYKVLRRLGVGPVIIFSLDEYLSCSESGTSCSVPDKAAHEWLTFGLRGVFDIVF
jgi:hypothetical protein